MMIENILLHQPIIFIFTHLFLLILIIMMMDAFDVLDNECFLDSKLS